MFSQYCKLFVEILQPKFKNTTTKKIKIKKYDRNSRFCDYTFGFPFNNVFNIKIENFE